VTNVVTAILQIVLQPAQSACQRVANKPALAIISFTSYLFSFALVSFVLLSHWGLSIGKALPPTAITTLEETFNTTVSCSKTTETTTASSSFEFMDIHSSNIVSSSAHQVSDFTITTTSQGLEFYPPNFGSSSAAGVTSGKSWLAAKISTNTSYSPFLATSSSPRNQSSTSQTTGNRSNTLNP